MSDSDKKEEKKKLQIPEHFLAQIQGDEEIKAKLSAVATAAEQLNSITHSVISSPQMERASLITRAYAEQMSHIAKMMDQHRESLAKMALAVQPAITVANMLGELQNRMKPILTSVKPILIAPPPSQQPQTINVDAALLEEISKLKEENEELKRYIELLLSKKKSDYVQ